jgi:glycosyltransferase involved in cell wall biosynthesis
VTVLTTCAEDYVTWANALPPGESRDGAMRVLRFPVRAERDLGRWEATMQPILRDCWTAAEEEAMLVAQGPDAPGLLDHLRRHGREYDAVIFFTLLYAPTVFGLPLVWDRAILVPTLHEEAAARLGLQGRALRLARHVIWLTAEERATAESLYDVSDLRGDLAGSGIDAPPPAGSPPPRFGLERPYLLYAGRIDPEKGCSELFDAFLGWAEDDGRADLALAGRAWMEIPRHPRVHHLGFVERSELWALTHGAVATVVPSRHESLSLVALESLAAATPIVVPADSPVLLGHARRSGGGIVYRDVPELRAAFARLLDDAGRRTALGAAGRAYVEQHYAWDGVLAVYESAIGRVSRRTSPRRTG